MRNFQKYAGPKALTSASFWHRIVLAQHHGLPTRLVDWSFSPYVALHFATADPLHWHEDAAIWCVDYVKIKRCLPPQLRRSLTKENSDVLTTSMLDQVAPSLSHFERLSRAPFVAFFEPPSFDQRIVNQSALLSLPSRSDLDIAKWLHSHDVRFRRIIIPARLKAEIRDKLDQANINERILFPGLDGLTRWLTRYYGRGDASRGESPRHRD